MQAERRVEREVARRLESAAADESNWPSAAREELARLSQRLESSTNISNSLQAELESEVAAHEREAISRASLQASTEMHSARLLVSNVTCSRILSPDNSHFVISIVSGCTTEHDL